MALNARPVNSGVGPLRVTLMLRLIKSRAFTIGFVVAIAFFIVANLYSYGKEMNPDVVGCYDCLLSFGFPFKFYENGGIGTMTGVRAGGLIANFYVVAFVSFGAGLACKLLFGEQHETQDS
jgi:hypothetical protein